MRSGKTNRLQFRLALAAAMGHGALFGGAVHAQTKKAAAPSTQKNTSQPTTQTAGEKAAAEDEAVSEEAIAFLEDRVKDNPDNSAMSVRLASKCLERAKLTHDFRLYARADAALEGPIRKDPTYFPAFLARGSSRLGQHRFREAVEDAEAALKLRADAPEAIGLRGDALLQLGELARARADYESLITTDKDLLAFVRMANLQFAEGNPQASLESLDSALKAGQAAGDPPALIAWGLVRLGELQFRLGDSESAARWYEAADTLQNNDPDVLDHLAELHAAKGEFEPALKFSERALAIAPRPEFEQSRGDIYLAMGHPQEAFEAHQKALDGYLAAASAGHAHYFHHLAAIYSDVEALRDPTQAQRWAYRDLQVRKTVNTYDALGWALYQQGKMNEAADAMDKALRQPTADSHVLYHASLIYAEAGDAKKGRLYLRRAAAANPKFNQFHFHR